MAETVCLSETILLMKNDANLELLITIKTFTLLQWRIYDFKKGAKIFAGH